MTSTGPLLFDSHALLKFFQKEPGHADVARLLDRSRRTPAQKLLNVINLGEIIYTTKRAFGDQKRSRCLRTSNGWLSRSCRRRTAWCFMPPN